MKMRSCRKGLRSQYERQNRIQVMISPIHLCFSLSDSILNDSLYPSILSFPNSFQLISSLFGDLALNNNPSSFIYQIGMSISSEKVKLLQVNEVHQESFFRGHDEDADLPPTELSGDENGEQSVFSQVDSKNKSNFLLTVTTIIKTVIGSGILGLPFTVSKCGWVFALVVFFLATAVTQFGSVLLLKAKNLSGHSNYSTILYHIYQNKFCKSLGSILIFLNNMGICILEIIIFKESIHHIIESVVGKDSEVMQEWYTQKYFIALVIACLEIPSILVKKIEQLKFMAFIGVTGILMFMGTFVVHYFIRLDERGAGSLSMRAFPEDWFKAISSIPNLILALAFQMNFFPVFKGMRNANDKKMGLATLTGLLVCAGSYLLVGIMGYHLVYSIENGQTGEVSANFLSNIPYDGVQPIVYFLINCCFLLSVFFAFPIMYFGCRNNFIALVQLFTIKDEEQVAKKWRQNTDNVEQISSYIQSEDKVERRRKANQLFYIYTFSIFAVIVAIGVALDDIEAVFNIIGAVCSSSISILLPCFFYFMLVIKKNKPRNINFFLAFGVFAVMAPFALFSVIAKYIQQ